MPLHDLQHYAYRGARAMVILHDQELRKCLVTWRAAKAAGIPLPKTDDPDYQSKEHLLHHILRAARGYLSWMCEMLGLPDPGLPTAPEPAVVEREAEAYLEQLLTAWREPLAGVAEPRFDETYKSRWGVDYCIDAMLEHAVMHPLRHRFQLEELLES
ncbi:hypothetical protein HZB60_09155 [candidate division KSB1 bacterium]|nr:hypothetical protein [candidate division KSB1 bacterium]